MESRKVILFGRSSYVISLPKSWLEANQLTKGSSVFVEHRPGGLVLSASDANPQDRAARIECDAHTPGTLRSEIMARYLLSYTTLVIEGKRLPEFERQVKHQLSQLAGLEIVEHSSTRLVLKDVMDVKQIALPSLLGRLELMVSALLHDMIDSDLKVPGYRERVAEIHRLLNLICRTVARLRHVPSLGPALGTTIVIAYREEGIAFGLNRLASFLSELLDTMAGAGPATLGLVQELLAELDSQLSAFLHAAAKNERQQMLLLAERVDETVAGMLERISSSSGDDFVCLSVLRNVFHSLAYAVHHGISLLLIREDKKNFGIHVTLR